MKQNKELTRFSLEDICLMIPKGKYRLVMLDFWEYTADVIGDFESLEIARKYLEEYSSLEDEEPDENTDFVIYNDKGDVVFDFNNFPHSSKSDVFIEINNRHIQINKNTRYIATIIFYDDTKKTEKVLFEETQTLKEAMNVMKEFEEMHGNAKRLVIYNEDGKIIWKRELE